MIQDSVSPSGEPFPLPTRTTTRRSTGAWSSSRPRRAAQGQEIVVVMGLGFVGAVMAAIVADTTDAEGGPTKFVIGCQRPSPRSYWKIPMLNRGVSPVKAEDPEVDPMIARACWRSRRSTATYNSDCLKLADCVVVDVQCDYAKQELGNMRTGEADMAALEATLRSIGERIPPSSAWSSSRRRWHPARRSTSPGPSSRRRSRPGASTATPLLAHSFERVMPGRQYVASIRDFWRVCSGCNDEARRGSSGSCARSSTPSEYPLTVMDRPIESETTKIVENSYRATILAFLDEWSLFAERNGVDLAQGHRRRSRCARRTATSCSRAPASAATACPRTAAWGTGRTSTSSASRTATSVQDHTDRHRHQRHARPPRRDAGARRAAQHGPPHRRRRACCSAAPATARTSATRATADRRSWSASSPRWAPRCACTTLTWITGRSSRARTPTRPPATRWRGSSATRSTLDRNCASRRTARRRCTASRPSILAVPHEPYLELEPDEVVAWAGKPVAVIDCFGILDDATSGATSSSAAR